MMHRQSVVIVAILVAGYSLYLAPALVAVDAASRGTTVDAATPVGERETATNGSMADVSLRFEDVSAEVGPAYVYERKFDSQMSVMSNAGIYAADYDSDGWTDLLAIGSGQPVLFHNDRGSFERSGELADVNVTARSALFFDHDTDGRTDLLLLAANRTPLLFENDGDTFVRVDAGFERRLEMPVSATAGDFDGDGALDLFVVQYGDWQDRRPIGLKNYSIPPGRDNGNSNYLYDGDGTSFERVTDAGIDETHWSLATSAVDLNGDGHLDIHVANDFYYDVVYLNRGDGTFQKRRLGDRTNRNGMSSEVADVNRDGKPDLFVTNIWFPELIGRELTDVNKLRYQGNNLLVNRGDGTFAYRADQYGVKNGGWGWAAVIADFDNDMDRDLFHTTSWIPFLRTNTDFDVRRLISFRVRFPFYRYPVVAERNETAFIRPLATQETGLLKGDTRGVARLDFDNDGDLDLVVANASERGIFRTYENRAAPGNALQVRVVGENGEPALGATVRIRTGNRVQHRWVTARADFLSQDSRLVHVGAGNNTRVDVTVTWPDGTVRTFENVAVGQRLVVGPGGVKRRVDLTDRSRVGETS